MLSLKIVPDSPISEGFTQKKKKDFYSVHMVISVSETTQILMAWTCLMIVNLIQVAAPLADESGDG